MTTRNTLTAATLAGLIGLAAPFAAPVMAQQADPQPEAVTEAELDAFVAAYRSVAALNQEYTPRIEQAEDAAEEQELLAEVQTRMAEAVEATPGMDSERYFEILTIAQADPELRADIVAQLQQ